MGRRYLTILERGFRGTLEEQYGHILWLSSSLRQMKLDADILLRGIAVLYAARGQTRQRLVFGRLGVDHLPDYEGSIERFLADGGTLFAMGPDCRKLGLGTPDLIPGVREIDLPQLGRLLADYDVSWYW